MKYMKPLRLFEESVKNYSTVLFGLSVCDKHVSLSISNEVKMSAFLFGCWPRDENFLDKLVNSIEGYMSKTSGGRRREFDVDGIIVGKNPVGLIDEMCKTGKLKDMKYTYWEDNITSDSAEASKVYKDLFVRRHSADAVDMFSGIHVLQGYVDCFNTFLHEHDPLLCPRQPYPEASK